MEYLKVWISFKQIMSELTDEEKGRLFDAMLDYAADGTEPKEFKGNERFIWASAKRDIDLIAKRLESDTNNGRKGGRPPKEKPNETQQNPIEKTITPKQNKTKQNNNNLVVVDKEPFELTPEQIHESITRDQQIEDAAINVGLKTSAQAMIIARNLAETYGTEKLLEAIRLSVDVPTWAYVEGILKNKGGNNDRHTRNNTKPAKNPYGFLHDRETAI